MGVELKSVTTKWDDETFEAAAELHEMFAPFLEGRSHVVRFSLKNFRNIVRTPGMLEVVVKQILGTYGVTSSHQRTLEFPANPPTSQAGEGAAQPGRGNEDGPPRLSIAPRLNHPKVGVGQAGSVGAWRLLPLRIHMLRRVA